MDSSALEVHTRMSRSSNEHVDVRCSSFINIKIALSLVIRYLFTETAHRYAEAHQDPNQRRYFEGSRCQLSDSACTNLILCRAYIMAFAQSQHLHPLAAYQLSGPTRTSFGSNPHLSHWASATVSSQNGYSCCRCTECSWVGFIIC